MVWKEFFGITKPKIVLFAVLAIVMNVIQTEQVRCFPDAFGPGVGECVQSLSRGFPFQIFGIWEIVGNAILAYFIVSIFFSVHDYIAKR
jgi:hypothetical protein